MAQKLHKKHISTRVGVSILAGVFIILGIVVFQLNQMQQGSAGVLASDSSMGSAPPGDSSFGSAPSGDSSMGSAPSSESMGSAPKSTPTPRANPKKKQSQCVAVLDNKQVKGSTTKAKCQDIRKDSCAGGYITDPYCPGDNNIQCCVISKACERKGGKCISYNDRLKKEGTFLKGFCPGPSKIQCFVPNK